MSEAYIYTGVWLNWSRDIVVGWTLTLRSKEASLLTSFLAVFTSTAGTQAWKIVSYLLHQLRAGQIPGDGRHQQAQVILRNTSSSLGAAWELVMLGWPWRKMASSGVWRVIMLSLVALLHASGWAVASVFSSRFTQSTGDEVLIRSPKCGYYTSPNTSDLFQSQFTNSKDTNATNDAAHYVRQCYGETRQTPFCDQYTVPQIPWKKNANATCPFDPKLCTFTDNAAAFEMDTGVLNSLDSFGINTPRSEAVGYRKVTTCAPMHAGGLARIENDTSLDGSPGKDQYVRYYFGPTIGGGDNIELNWTYQYKVGSFNDGGGYELTTRDALAADFSAAWIPAPELNRTDADVSLFFLAGGDVSYTAAVDDPLFAAHDNFTVGNLTIYGSDRDITILGCIDQHQFCNLNPKAGNQACTPLTGSNLVSNSFLHRNTLGFSNLQLAITALIYFDITSDSIFDSVLGPSSLLASSTLNADIQLPLPNNQWQIEVSNWFNIALAKLQNAITQYASGPPAPMTGSSITPPGNVFEKVLCYSQKVRQSQGHTSFSLLAVVIVLVVGGIIIITAVFIDSLVGFIQRKMRRGIHKATQWSLDEKLQLQRMAYEKGDIGRWQNCDGKVPITMDKMEHMGVVVEGEGGKHPSYVREWTGGVAEQLLGSHSSEGQTEGKGRYTSVVFEESV